MVRGVWAREAASSERAAEGHMGLQKARFEANSSRVSPCLCWQDAQAPSNGHVPEMCGCVECGLVADPGREHQGSKRPQSSHPSSHARMTAERATRGAGGGC